MKANRYISRIASLLILGGSLLSLTSCSEEEDMQLTSSQKNLIGRAVHFDPYVEGYRTRAVNHDGFNINDPMYIFRKSMKEDGSYSHEEEWKTYMFTAQNDPSGNVLFSQWEIMRGDNVGFRGGKQEDSDSIYWENGRSVRFRAYSKSSLYDDYLYADYVATSGPMGSVPMEFKHLGCRIGFTPYSGNTLSYITYCTEKEDYMRADNADSHTGADEADKLPEAEAEQVAAEVKKVFDKICMPGGIAMYANAGNNWYTRDNVTGAETTTEVDPDDLIPQAGQLTAKNADGTGEVLGKYVTTANTMRPNWNSNLDGTRYCIMIPYEMSGENAGNSITIPAKTRFKVYLKDVNTHDQENNYHIFSLSDIKDEKNVVDGVAQPKYPKGLTLRAGYSYVFTVGYKYNRLEVRVNEEGINWSNPGETISSEGIADEMTASEPEYTWWRNAMNEAAEKAMNDKDNKFKPVFVIHNMKEWNEFTNIVNGTFPYTPGNIQKDEEGVITSAEGCIQYTYYYAPNGLTEKHTEQRVLTEAYDFSGMEVCLDCDLDFHDQLVTPIGTKDHPFRGMFTGDDNILSNLTGTVFGYVEQPNEKTKAAVTQLKIKSALPVSLINEAKGADIRFIMVQAPSAHAITTTVNKCDILACVHLGTGNQNGSMFGKGAENTVTASYIAAAGKGTLTDDTSFGGTFAGCYYDCTLSPGINTIGNEYTISYLDKLEDYGARAVDSQVLKAVKDNIPGRQTPENKKVYYGLAPVNVLNKQLKENKVSDSYCFFIFNSVTLSPGNYSDIYPTLMPIR